MSSEIQGICDERFQPLKDAFVANFEDGLELGASLCLMERGRPVVDLWAGWANFRRTRPWEADTIVGIASNTKIATALCLLMLIDRGKVDLDATVATYWPEFAQGGKGHVTVRQALSHRAGVPGYEPPVAWDAPHDWERITAHIAAEPHWFGGEPRLCYHAHTYGFVLGEIVRRAAGRRPAQFFAEEVAGPGGVDLQIGLRVQTEVARSSLPYALRPVEPMHFDDPLAQRVWDCLEPAPIEAYMTWEHQHYAGPSGSGYASARGVARLVAIFAAGGTLDGVHFLSKALVDEATHEQVFAPDPFFGMLRMGLGFGLDSEGFPAPSPTAFHWGGSGGSLQCGDQRTGLSFGYVTNNFIITAEPFAERRFDRLWTALGAAMTAAAAETGA
ncbi:MAG TPA: serine hydrolase domain-containing protein [Caulobacteraceae bacterium]|nr:serine hydrolase domain-containing protein [Caulobacteraceae bacterium]